MGIIRDVSWHVVLLSFTLELTRNLIYDGHTLQEILPVPFEEDIDTVHGIKERKCSGHRSISRTSDLERSEHFIAQKAVSKCREEKINVVLRGYTQLLRSFTGVTMNILPWPREICRVADF